MTIFLSRFKLNLCLTVTILLLLWPSPSSIRAVTENSPLLSQVQISGGPGKTTNDFIELYNPNQTDLDLKGLRLVKRAKTSSTDTLIKSWTSSTIIKAHSYYLWANSSFTDISATPDITTSPTIADDNAIAIRSGSNDTGTIIDSLAWGQANNGLNQSSVFPTNPRSNQSLERKPGTNSFFLQSNPHPRNSLSVLEPEIITTPSPTSPTVSEFPTPTPSVTSTPSNTPVVTPESSVEPTQNSPTPMSSPTPSPTEIPQILETPTTSTPGSETSRSSDSATTATTGSSTIQQVPEPTPTSVFTSAPTPIPRAITSGPSVAESLPTITPLPTQPLILNEIVSFSTLPTTTSAVSPSSYLVPSTVSQVNKIVKKDLPNQSSKSLASVDTVQNTKSNKTFLGSIFAVAAIVILYLLL